MAASRVEHRHGSRGAKCQHHAAAAAAAAAAAIESKMNKTLTSAASRCTAGLEESKPTEQHQRHQSDADPDRHQPSLVDGPPMRIPPIEPTNGGPPALTARTTTATTAATTTTTTTTAPRSCDGAGTGAGACGPDCSFDCRSQCRSGSDSRLVDDGGGGDQLTLHRQSQAAMGQAPARLHPRRRQNSIQGPSRIRPCDDPATHPRPVNAIASEPEPDVSISTVHHRRQDFFDPPPSASPSLSTIQDPFLKSFLQSSPSSLNTSASSEQSSTALTVTIVLAALAGLATLLLASLLLFLRWKRPAAPSAVASRRPRGRGPSKLRMQAYRDIKDPGSSLNSPTTPTPLLQSPRSAASFAMSAGASSRFSPTPGHGKLTPPPRLLERRYHQSTKSDSSIPLVRKASHQRWGKPSSLSILRSGEQASYAPSDVYEDDTVYSEPRTPPAAGPSHRYEHYNLSQTRLAASSRNSSSSSSSSSSSHFFAGKNVSSFSSNYTSPPRTPGVPPEVMGLASPGPPPTRALPSPPLRHWQINPLSPSADNEMDRVLPEEIGVAIGSPMTLDAKHREKRPRLDERDMERLGGTYSPFKR